MPGQSDGDPLDQDLHSEPPSPLIPSSRGDRASYAPHTAPSSTENLYVCPPIDVPPTGILYHLQYSIPESFPTPLSDSSAPTLFSPYGAFLGDQIMPNGTPRYPQPGIYPIPAALPPVFPLHMYNPPMPLSLPQTPIATRQLEPHANSERDAPSFELDFAGGLFEGVIPGTASGRRRRKKFEWNETFDVEDRLLVLLRCMRLSLDPPSQQISSQNYMIKTLGL